MALWGVFLVALASGEATDRYLMLTKRGVELLDLTGGEHMRNDRLRAMCHYGFMPCNGLLYVPPHHCFCYPGVKMTGRRTAAMRCGVGIRKRLFLSS
jgi:hypothetical protein